MNILLTGATGFLGTQITRRLLDESHTVTALTRNPTAAREALPTSVAFVASIPNDLSPYDAIVTLAGESIAGVRWTPKKKERIRLSRIGALRNLNACLEGTGRTKPLVTVSASAVGYYGDRGDERLTESSSPGQGFLAGVCKDWEAQSLLPISNARRIALRFGVLLGGHPPGGALAPMLIPFRLGLGGRISHGSQWMSWIHLDDAASLILWALHNPQAQGAYNATAPNPVTNAEFTKTLSRLLRRPAILPVPAFALRLLFGESASVLLESQRVMPERATQAGFAFQYPNLGDALAEVFHK